MLDPGQMVPVSLHAGSQAEALGHQLNSGNETTRSEAATRFEGVFLSLLIKEMRRTVGGEGLFAGDQSDTYGAMFDMFLGRELAQTSGLGIDQMITRYLEQSSGQSPESRARAEPNPPANDRALDSGLSTLDSSSAEQT